MATATKKKKKPTKRERRPKQQLIVDDFVPKVKEIDDAADDYVTHRDARMAAREKEITASDNLLALMKEHKLTSYEYDGKIVSIAEHEKIKVKRKPGENGESDF